MSVARPQPVRCSSKLRGRIRVGIRLTGQADPALYGQGRGIQQGEPLRVGAGRRLVGAGTDPESGGDPSQQGRAGEWPGGGDSAARPVDSGQFCLRRVGPAGGGARRIERKDSRWIQRHRPHLADRDPARDPARRG